MGGNGLVVVVPVDEWEEEFRLALGQWLGMVRRCHGRERSAAHPFLRVIKAKDSEFGVWLSQEEWDTLESLQSAMDDLLKQAHIGGRPYRNAYQRVLKGVKRGR